MLNMNNNPVLQILIIRLLKILNKLSLRNQVLVSIIGFNGWRFTQQSSQRYTEPCFMP